MLTAYPDTNADLIDERAEWEMQAVIDLISRVRNIRSEMNIKPGERVPLLVGAPDERLREVFSRSIDQISRLVRASDVSIRPSCLLRALQLARYSQEVPKLLSHLKA